MPDEFRPLADAVFDIDDDEDADRAYTSVVDDESLSLLRHANRLGLAQGDVTPVPVDDPAGRSAWNLPLLFVLHAHPECTFTWARLVVDLAGTPGSVVRDMSPREVQDVPVEVETTVGLDVSFSLAAKAVDIGAKPELARKRTVFFPTLLTSGVGFRKAYWDFLPKAGDYLHADKELRLLVEADRDVPVAAAVTVRAKVRFRGLPGLIPLLARTGTVTANLSGGAAAG